MIHLPVLRPLPWLLSSLLLLLTAGAPAGSASAAEEGVVPPGYRGTYVKQALLEALTSRKERVEGLEPSLQVDGSTVTEERAQEATRYRVTGAEGAGKQTTLRAESPHGEGSSTWKFVKRRGQATRGEGKERRVRLEDAAPPLAHFGLRSTSLAGLLARGYRTEDGKLLLVEDVIDWKQGATHTFLAGAPGSTLRGLDEAKTIQGFETLQPESLRLGWGSGHKDFLVTQKKGDLLLEELAPAEGPDPVALEGGVVIRAILLPQAPYRVMADTLSLRASPDWSTKPLGALHLGDRVSLWARTQEPVTRGGLTGHFGLIQKGKQLGWAFLPYLGRLLPEDGAPERFTAVAFTAMEAPVYQSWQDEDGAHCGLNPKGEASELVFVPLGGMTPESAEWALANLDGDGTLDPACVMRDEKNTRVCAFRSLDAKGAGLLAAGCVSVPGTATPGISSKDVNGDGHRDLRIGPGKKAAVFHFDPTKKAFVAP